MKKREKKNNLSNFLKAAESAAKARLKKCTTCNRPEDAALVLEFLEKKASGEHSISLPYFFDAFLVQGREFPASLGALRHHVRHCLRRDARSGKLFTDRSR